MTNNLGRTEVSVSQTQKETAINNSDAILDAAITGTLTITWAGAEATKVISSTQMRQNVCFVMAGSTTEPTPVLQCANVQRGMFVVTNNLAQDVTVEDFGSATTLTVPAGMTVAIYGTASAIVGIFASASLADAPSDTKYYARKDAAWVDIGFKVNAEVGTSFTLDIDDANDTITATNAAAIAATVPTNASVPFPIGTKVRIIQGGAGVVTVSGAGVTFEYATTLHALVTNGIHTAIELTKTATDTWKVESLVTPFDVGAFISGTPTASVMFWQMLVARPCTFAGNFAGSYGRVETNPSSTVNVDVQKNGSSVGTMSIANTGVFTFTTTAGAAVSLAAGDRLTMVAPADLFTLVSITFVVKGHRT